jgi:hypothetical protein
MSKRSDSNRDITQELSEFLALPEESGAARERPAPGLLARVSSDLSPGFAEMAVRVGGIHVLSSLLSVSVCPQFGVGPLGGGHGIMGFFMRFGDIGCAIGCGAFYMGVTAGLTRALLGPDQKRALKHQGLVQFSWLIAASWAFFMLGGSAGSASPTYLAAWGLSALITGVSLSRAPVRG